MDDKLEIGLNKIDIISVARDVLRQWWVILILSISAALFADVWVTETYQPQYTTQTTFAVTAKGLNSNVYQNLTSTKELAERFSQVLDSTVLKKKVAEELGKKEFNAETSVEQVPETNLLTLKVTAGSSMEAYHIIQCIMQNYNTVSDYVIENVILDIIQQPVVPVKPVNPLDKGRAVKISVIIVAVLLLACFAAFSYMRDTVKNPGEVSGKIDARFLGTVYHEKKKKKAPSMLIQNPLRSFRYVESNKMTASKIRSQVDKTGAKIILFTSVMENEGKSTVAANVALSLAQEGKKVMLMDCDFRKPAQYRIFDVSEKDTPDFTEVLKSGTNINQMLLRWKESSLYLVLNKKSSASMEALLKNGIFKKIIQFYKKRMDYILIDTSPLALVSDTEELAQLVDASVLVVKEDTVLTKDINDAIDVLNNTNGKVLGCVFNDAMPGISGSIGHYGYGRRYGYGGYYGKRV